MVLKRKIVSILSSILLGGSDEVELIHTAQLDSRLFCFEEKQPRRAISYEQKQVQQFFNLGPNQIDQPSHSHHVLFSA